VPVVFLTAKAMPAELDRLRALGARAIVTKPFDPAALPGLVRQALARDPDAGPSGGGSLAPAPDMSGAAARIVDAGALDQLQGLVGEQGGDLVSELIALFASNTPESIRQLRDAAGGRGAGDAERVAHSLKGAASMLGATGIADLARAIENLARGGRTSEVGPLVDRIDALLEPTLAHLRARATT
jgi:HPt (histidine-containing phosphotransfer) domain-containing protein